MHIIKRLDLFILKAFLQLFAATFFVCLFVFMMQYTWRYIDELIGKGLSVDVLAKFFWYMALNFVPAALPPGVLLASLITFGNMGEKLELLSMKAAGVPLLRILQPLLIVVVILSGCSFYFQNNIAPEATKRLSALVWSMKQKSPELEIPEGVFYSEIPGYNIFVEKKDMKTGMLYGVMIYTNVSSQEDTQIVLADSARLQSTADKMHLMLTMYSGERFRNMDARSANMMKANVPYMRETFAKEIDLIEFDGNFNITDASLFAGNAQTKGLRNIRLGIDSLNHRIDSVGASIYEAQCRGAMERQIRNKSEKDSAHIVAEVAQTAAFDSLYAGLSHEQLQSTIRTATSKVRQLTAEYEFRSMITNEDNRSLRIHKVEKHKKFTYSLACLLFFFIGAPLGAIIRKGGLGVPVVISVVIFIFYYIINVGSEKMAKTGQWNIVSGIWLSSMVLLPIGLFLINRANKDSVVFNIEGYMFFFRRLLGLRAKRNINRKEVIINPPSYRRVASELEQLSADCAAYVKRARLHLIPNYWKLFFRYRHDKIVVDISERLEMLVEELHNSRDAVILTRINELPVLVPDAHTRPFGNRRLNMAAGILLPVGILLFLRVWRYRLRLWKDLQQIQKISKQITDRIIDKGYE